MASIDKPRGVKVSSTLIGILPLFTSLLIAVFHSLTTRGGYWQSFLILIVFMAITQPVGLVLAYGLRKGRKWAFYITILVAVFGIFGAILSFLDAALVSRFNFTAHRHQLLTIPMSTSCIFTCPTIIYYLTRQDVRAFFIKPSE